MARFRYAPWFCEENVWHLLGDPGLSAPPETRTALIVTNAARAVAMWGQRAARGRDPILWDYHVVVLAPIPGTLGVWDLDGLLPLGVPLPRWVAHSFRPVPPPHQPRFRVVPGPDYRTLLSSDRSHMRDAEGHPTRPFPPWDPIFDPARGMNLPLLVDPERGTWLDREGLLLPRTG